MAVLMWKQGIVSLDQACAEITEDHGDITNIVILEKEIVTSGNEQIEQALKVAIIFTPMGGQ
jgi:hypothetical protein